MTRIQGLVLAALPVLMSAAPAFATNENTTLVARTCSPYVANGCDEVRSSVPLANGVGDGGGYAFASGYLGGLAIASAGFQPGAAPLLLSGNYENSALANYAYTVQIAGMPNTLVPLHVSGVVSVSPIHITDKSGQVIDLVDGVSTTAPSDRWHAVANASLKIVSTRLTPFSNSSAGASAEGQYDAYLDGTSYCQNCDGGFSSLDKNIWVYSNSDIVVTLDANVLLTYMAVGNGNDPISTFGSVSATADPTFSIDDPAYSGFTIVGVPSGNPPTVTGEVPEPASWAMMIGGMGLVGGAMRQRKRTVCFV